MMQSTFSIFFKEMIRIDLKEEIVKYICIKMTSLVLLLDFGCFLILFGC